MAVDDHGLETIRKAGEELTPGDKSDYYIKVNDLINKLVLDDILAELASGITPSGLNIGGKITEVTLNAVTWTALPIAALASRNGLGLQNSSSTEIKLNFSAAVVGYLGWVVNSKGETFLDITENITLYAKAKNGNPVITIMEVA